MYLLGYDIGSSSVKAALVDAHTGKTINVTQSPKSEMGMIAHQNGWAEQNPSDWWNHLCIATKELIQLSEVDSKDIKSIGISYQMHGLVLVDKNKNVLRPSIIWCDSRAVDIGNDAFYALGEEYCLSHMLNSPGNFTASKLAWVAQNEPELFEKVDHFMLPGDYIAMKLTNEVCTTVSGLSEGIFWDFKNEKIASPLLSHFKIDESLVPPIKDTSSMQGNLTPQAAKDTGLEAGTPVTYRAGDQPNNALSLGVLEKNEVAATGGTSGVIYAVVDEANYDDQSRVNGFAHVNHSSSDRHIGILLCINGTGIQYAWVRQNVAIKGLDYVALEEAASTVPIGSEGLSMLPFGNGAERILNNRNIGAQIQNLNFNIHKRTHLYRAALEGIAFSFYYGFQILKDMGLDVSSMKVGNDNLFQSAIFSETVSTLLDSEIKVLDTTGAVGAAKASGVATGIYSDLNEATRSQKIVRTYHPNEHKESYTSAYEEWYKALQKHLK